MGEYYNVICEEIELTGGKVIHIDKNLGNMNDVHKLVCENIISKRQMGTLFYDT